MANRLCTAVVLQAILACGLCHHRPAVPVKEASSDGGPGEPLFLTPYLERGAVAEARRLARVPDFDNLQVESYAGFFTVNKTHHSNQFVWYFPSMSANRDNDPVILWLAGGPGSSGLVGVFYHSGPMYATNRTLRRREHHWALNHHMIYIDSPVGTGFSFTDKEGYCTDETQIAEQLYTTLTQFFHLFPELKQNKFFISGESYGGKYAPALGYTIHHKNPTAVTKINFKGLAIGNGWTDPVNQLVYSQYLYQIGLIDINARKVFEEYENNATKFIRNRQWIKATETCNKLHNFESYPSNLTGYHTGLNFLRTEELGSSDDEDYNFILNQVSFRKSIHVGDLPFKFSGGEVYRHLYADIMKSVAPWLSELLDHYYCLIYNGQLDLIVPYPATLNYLQKLNFSGSEEYKTAERSIWRVGGEVAGYAKRGGRLVEVLVRNAGHSACEDQPEWAEDLIYRFTHNANYWDH